MTTDENTLLFIADILAQLASSSVGFHKILYGNAAAAAGGLVAAGGGVAAVGAAAKGGGDGSATPHSTAAVLKTPADNQETPAFVVASFTLRALLKDGQVG